jgi:hypothetical protein
MMRDAITTTMNWQKDLVCDLLQDDVNSLGMNSVVAACGVMLLPLDISHWDMPLLYMVAVV